MEKIYSLQPFLSPKIWGGESLSKQFAKTNNATEQLIGESWEISAHPDGEAIIENGSYSGNSLAQLVSDHPEVLGSYPNQLGYFPVLTKFIDANEALSIQVHPEDEYANTHDNDNGKTEMWYIIDAKPDSYIYLGPKEDLNKEQITRALKDGTFEHLLQAYPVTPGDCYYVSAGTIHAIGAGVLVYEVQQSSNITYRLYDYNRPDSDGNLRELHIEKSLDVLDYEPVDQQYVSLTKDRKADDEKLFHGKYFQTDIINNNGERNLRVGEESFLGLTLISGTATANRVNDSLELQAGQTIFVPAGPEELKITGTGKAITVRVEANTYQK